MLLFVLLLVGALACVPTYSPDDLARIYEEEELEEIRREEEIRLEEEILESMTTTTELTTTTEITTTTTEVTTTTTTVCDPVNCPLIYSCAELPAYQDTCRPLADTSGNPTTMVMANGGICVFSVFCPPAMGATPPSEVNYRDTNGDFESMTRTTPLSIQCANNGVWTRTSNGVQVNLVNCGYMA